MTTYIFDIETNGLLEETTKVHSLVMIDLDTDELFSFTDHVGYRPIAEGLKLLAEADEIIGHNIICFDIPALKKIYPNWNYKGKVTDTLVLSRLIYPDVKPFSYTLRAKYGDDYIKGNLLGSHSLEAWGMRLGLHKGDFSKTTDWKDWSPEMQSYCEQDVRVTKRLYLWLKQHRLSKEAVKLEHEFRYWIFLQEQYGFKFDVEKAVELYAELSAERDKLREKLQEAFPPKIEKTIFIPKVNNSKLGYKKGVPIEKVKETPFNPSSDIQISERLIEKYGWKPTEFTDKGQPVVSETVLSKLDYPEIPLILRYMVVNKRIGQLAEGTKAWLKLEKNGRLHGRVITNGAVTGRCTHHDPNLAQVPEASERVPYGIAFRSLFQADEGYSLVGCDASSLELRCLAHYTYPYDTGEYAKAILEGDIHTLNQKSAGLPTRQDAKRFIYAFLYGAGDKLLGSILEPTADSETQKLIGKKLRRRFLQKTPALKYLQKKLEATLEKRDYLFGIDGRVLQIRAKYSALNTLLQSAGAIVMKKATTLLWDMLTAKGYVFGREVAQVAHVHDEFQLVVRHGLEEEVGRCAVEAIRKAGEYFGFRCPLDGEYKVGTNWAETH